MLQATVLHLPKFPKSLHSPSPINQNNLQPKMPKITSNTSSIYSDDQNSNTKVVVEIQEKKQQSLLTTIFYSLDDFVSNLLDSSPLPPSIDPHHLLSGNFAPVEELPPTACEVVEGSLPTSLNGAYIRNGPNPHFFPRGPYHPFDGDGMLHSISISGGQATFCSRYVKTYKFKTEAENGRPFFPSPFSSCHGGLATAARFLLTVARGAFGQFDPSANGFGTANTSLACFNGNLYALCESDLPYQIQLAEDGDIITLGRCDFGGGRDMTERMTAHPHSDPDSGEVFAFKCNVFAPFLAFFKIDSGGKRGSDLTISSMKRMACVHDFGLTKRFIVFQDVQIEMDPVEVVMGRTPLVCHREKVPRVGILPREAANDGGVVWIETPGLNLLHITNAWEGDCGGRIVIVAPNFLAADRGFLDTSLMHSRFEMIELDINEKKVVSRCVLSRKNMEFGVINQAYAGKKNRYMYAAVIAEMPKAGGVVKIDLSKAGAEGSDCKVAMREFGEGCYGGEPYFVAGEGAEEEDDGYLVTYVHKESSEESWFWVMDAKSPTLEIVARVRLPGRVPYGYHGLFVPEKHLKLL